MHSLLLELQVLAVFRVAPELAQLFRCVLLTIAYYDVLLTTTASSPRPTPLPVLDSEQSQVVLIIYRNMPGISGNH